MGYACMSHMVSDCVVEGIQDRVDSCWGGPGGFRVKFVQGGLFLVYQGWVLPGSRTKEGIFGTYFLMHSSTREEIALWILGLQEIEFRGSNGSLDGTFMLFDCEGLYIQHLSENAVDLQFMLDGWVLIQWHVGE